MSQFNPQRKAKIFPDAVNQSQKNMHVHQIQGPISQRRQSDNYFQNNQIHLGRPSATPGANAAPSIYSQTQLVNPVQSTQNGGTLISATAKTRTASVGESQPDQQSSNPLPSNDETIPTVTAYGASPMKQKAESTNNSAIPDQAQDTFNSFEQLNENSERELPAPVVEPQLKLQVTQSIPEQDVEESCRKMPEIAHQTLVKALEIDFQAKEHIKIDDTGLEQDEGMPQFTMPKFDMNNFVVLSENQRTEELGERINLDSSTSHRREPSAEPPQKQVNFEQEHSKMSYISGQEFQQSQHENGLNDQAIFSRLPQNYFMEDEDQKDLNAAMFDIKKMREGFITHFADSGMTEQIQEMTEILQPQKFIEKCFGDAGPTSDPPEFLFNEVLQKCPSPERKTKEKTQTKEPVNMSNDFKNKTQEIDVKLETSLEQIPNEELMVEDSTVDKTAMQLGLDVVREAQKNKINSTFDQVIEDMGAQIQRSAREDMWAIGDVDSAQRTKEQEQQDPRKVFYETSLQDKNQRTIQPGGETEKSYQIDPKKRSKSKNRANKNRPNVQKYSRAPSNSFQPKNPNALRMADYFTIDQSINNTQNDDISANMMNNTAIETIESNLPYNYGALSPDSIIAASAVIDAPNIKEGYSFNKEGIIDVTQSKTQLDLKAAEEAEKKILLEKQLEKHIFENVDINFVFNKGQKLTEGLLDSDRIFNIMNKLKQLAMKQIEQGSKQINFTEIVEYIKSKESMFSDEFKFETGTAIDDQQVTHALCAEPPEIIANDNQEKDRRWTQCVNFMRNNPKLLLQMIPSDLDDLIDQQNKKNEKERKGRAHEKIEEAKKWQARQARLRVMKDIAVKKNEADAKKNVITKKIEENQKSLTGPGLGRKKSSKVAVSKYQSQTRKPPKTLNPLSDRKKSPSKINFQDQENSGNQTVNKQEEDVKRAKKFQSLRITDALNSGLNSESSKPIIAEMCQTAEKVDTKPTKVISKFQNRKGLFSPTDTNTTFQRMEMPRDGRERSKSNTAVSGLVPECITRDINSSIGRDTNIAMSQISHDFRDNSGTRKRPTTASAFGLGHKGTGKDLASNDIIRKHMLSRASVRRTYVSTQNQSLKQAAAIQSETSSNFQLPKFNRALNSGLNIQRGTHMPQVKGVFQFSGKNPGVLHQRGRSKDSKGIETYAQRQFARIVNSSDSGGSEDRATLPRNVKQQPVKNGELEFYPPNPYKKVEKTKPKMAEKKRKQKSASPKRLLKTKPQFKNRQKEIQTGINKVLAQEALISPDQPSSLNMAPIKSEQITPEQSKRPTPLRSPQSMQEDKSILGEENSINNQEGQKVEPLPYAMKSTDQSKEMPMIGKPDIEKQNLISQIEDDFIRDPLIDQRITSPIRFEEQIEKLIPEELNRDLQNQLEESPSPREPIENASTLVDWAYTPLCIKMLQKNTEFNVDKDIKLFVENEVDYVIDMMKNRFHDFERTEIMRPFYLKALSTLRCLLFEQHMEARFKSFHKLYREITIENTLKLLFRCKLAFHTRRQLLTIFELSLVYELAAKDMKNILDEQTNYKVKMARFNQIKETACIMTEAGQRVVQAIQTLRADKKSLYRLKFVFKRKDLVMAIKHEISEVKKLAQIFRPKRIDDSSDSDEPIRLVADPTCDQEDKEFEKSEKLLKGLRESPKAQFYTEQADSYVGGYGSGASVI